MGSPVRSDAWTRYFDEKEHWYFWFNDETYESRWEEENMVGQLPPRAGANEVHRSSTPRHGRTRNASLIARTVASGASSAPGAGIKNSSASASSSAHERGTHAPGTQVVLPIGEQAARAVPADAAGGGVCWRRLGSMRLHEDMVDP